MGYGTKDHIGESKNMELLNIISLLKHVKKN